MESTWTFGQVRQAVERVATATMIALLWLLLSLQALGTWLLVPRRQRAQTTVEILIGMAVVAVIALAVWRLIGPAIVAKANAVVTDLNTAGTGPTGTG